MATPAKNLEARGFMQTKTVLEERVDHIQRDVADMKGRIGKLEEKAEAIKDSVAALRTDLTAAMAAVKSDLTKHIHSVETKVGSLQADLNAVRAEIKQANLTLVMWMIGTMLALATLAFGIGRYVTLPAGAVAALHKEAT